MIPPPAVYYSMNANFHSLYNYGLQGGVTPWAGYMIPPPVVNYPYFYEWRTTQELYLRYFSYLSSYMIGCSSNEENTNLKDIYSCQLAENGPQNGIRHGDAMSQDKDLNTFNSRDDLRSAPSSSGVVKNMSVDQINVGPSTKTSTYESGGCSNVIPSNTEPPPESSRSKVLSSSVFSRQYRMGPVTMDKNKSKQGYASEGKSSTLENRNCLCTKVHSDGVVQGINLREWLDSKSSNTSKINKLVLFRQIVQTVDVAHAQGIALMELRPSSFTLLSTGGVKYVGPLMDNVKALNQGLEHEVFTHDRKKRKLDDAKPKCLKHSSSPEMVMIKLRIRLPTTSFMINATLNTFLKMK